ncbi:filamin/ABP280 repeat-containing protein [Cavenderia fasciculata]|uniref:Filamin/ABP280 repeat-containing protein n=1 Tax=Cavenderia fasciculata TaxID=261658 RepID=F4Q648_CACFS|nr:filamin/ABP280 repeat-containing protein [Cavenderia fasciculata]EGG16634.1 filamin/ABP280 repeat-containing protein [Cavenderia fasciculata]|eukprot:XP_004355108.1 filamin/ABP280 repeat-containing protein [Cavenderia fasciculata]
MRVLIELTTKSSSSSSSSSSSLSSSSFQNSSKHDHHPTPSSSLVDPKGKKFIEIHPNQSIWMLKTFIFGSFGIPPARQQAFVRVVDDYDTKERTQAYLKEFHNYRLVKDYKIFDGSEIQVEVLDKENPTEFIVAPKKTISSGSGIALSNSPNTSNSDLSVHLQRAGIPSSPSQHQINPTLPTSGSNKVHVLTSKKVSCPALCFALGKGLYRGISGCRYEIKLYRVNSKGMLINSTSNSPFQIEITKNISSVDSRMPFSYEQRKTDYSLLILSPQSYGDYNISIKIDETHICGSPFQCTIIDELNPQIKELAFSNEWVEEVVELITMISKKESTLDNLFSFGIEGLINLSAYPDPNIQFHITGVIARLMEKDKNKERILREYGMEIFFKIVSLETWISFIELRRFIASSLSILIGNRVFLNRFFDQCDISIILELAQSEHIDCLRYCSIVLCQLSENYEFSERVCVDEIKEILITMLQSKDSITKKCSLRAISNFSLSIDSKKEINLKLIQNLLDCCRNTIDISTKVLIYKSFSNFCRYDSLCTYLLNNGILDLICLNDPNNHFELPMFYQWEYNIKQLFASDQQQSIEYSVPYTQIFKDESDHTFFLSLTISNMLYTSNSPKIHERFSNNNGLGLLKQFVLCYNCSARVESFRSFMLITNSPNDICKKHLINNGIISFLMSSLFDSSGVENPFIINTIANLCEFDPFCVDTIGAEGIDKLISLLHQYSHSGSNHHNTFDSHNGESGTSEKSLSNSGGNNNAILLSISIVLSNIASLNDKYKTKIVNGGGKLFLHHLMELVIQKKVSLLKPIPSQDLVLGAILGSGVSGIVYRSTWNDHPVAVKSFNEESLGFEEKQFHMEATITSILNHENILHCVGGNRNPEKLYLVFDCMSRGSLFDIIHSKEIPLSHFKIVHILLQTAKGMQYLHHLGIIHRDLKSRNVLIDNDWNVRICDFGVSRVVDSRRMTRGAGTACNMAVEILSGSTEYNLKADVFSFGVLIWECVSRLEPYHDMNRLDWIRAVLEDGFRLSIPSSCPQELSQLTKHCWTTSPDSRPSFDQIVATLQSIKDSMIDRGTFEDFGRNNTPSPISASSFHLNKRYSIFLNENKVSIDLSSHPTEIMKNLVLDDQETGSMSTSSSPTLTKTSSPPPGGFSPDSSRDNSDSSRGNSPTNNNNNISKRSATSPPANVGWKKWEAKPNDKPTSKRISAFRTITKADLNAIAEMETNKSVTDSESVSSSPDTSTVTTSSPISPRPSTTTTTTTTTPIPIRHSNEDNQTPSNSGGHNENSGSTDTNNLIISPNTFSSMHSNMSSEISGVLTSSTNSVSTTCAESYSDPYGFSLPSSLYNHIREQQSVSGRSHTTSMVESTNTSRSNSSLSISDNYHPTFNAAEFEDLLSHDKQLQSQQPPPQSIALQPSSNIVITHTTANTNTNTTISPSNNNNRQQQYQRPSTISVSPTSATSPPSPLPPPKKAGIYSHHPMKAPAVPPVISKASTTPKKPIPLNRTPPTTNSNTQ